MTKSLEGSSGKSKRSTSNSILGYIISRPGNPSAIDGSIAQNFTVVNESYNREVDAKDTELPDFIEDSPIW
jgi:hypothetical protein